MKHLESFRDIFKKKVKSIEPVSEVLQRMYNIDDYVLITNYEDGSYCTKISAIFDDIDYMGRDGLYKLILYVCIFSDGDKINVTDKKNPDFPFFIERKMTDEEIKEYELESASNKYNI